VITFKQFSLWLDSELSGLRGCGGESCTVSSGEGTQARLLELLTTDRRGMFNLACVCHDAVSRPLFKVRIATDLGFT